MRFRKFILLLALGSVLAPSCQKKSIERSLTSPGVVLPLGAFDTPAANAPIKGQISFTGWAAHESGIAFVALYLDGIFQANANLGADRPDVLKSFPQFNSSMVSGWEASIDTSTWSAGPHTVIAKSVSRSGVDRDCFVNVIATR